MSNHFSPAPPAPTNLTEADLTILRRDLAEDVIQILLGYVRNAPSVPEAYIEDDRDELTPDLGQIIYNLDTDKLEVFTGAAWEEITSA